MKKITRDKYSRFSGYAKRLMQYMDRRNGGTYGKRIISNRLHIPYDEMDAAFRELQDAGLFEVERVDAHTIRVMEL